MVGSLDAIGVWTAIAI